MSRSPTAPVLRHLRALALAGEAAPLSDGQLLERFATAREEAAFEALVRRHGPLVLGVCRRHLHNAHDAEDAFQATFLVLARKAATIQQRETLSSWLYQVACRVAARTARRATARQQRECPRPLPQAADPLQEVSARELLVLLDQELQQLPSRLRAPLILCYLQEKTQAEAARALGCSPRTVQRRLQDGRARLQRRLQQRGVTLPAALLTTAVAGSTATAALPAGLLTRTVQVVVTDLARPDAIIAEQAAALAAKACRLLAGSKSRTGIFLCLTMALLTAGSGWLLCRDPRPAAGAAPANSPSPPAQTIPRPAARHATESPSGRTHVVQGRILDAQGKPVPGAEAALLANQYLLPGPAVWHRPPLLLGMARADAQGRFRLTARIEEPWRSPDVTVLAAARGHGMSWRSLPAQGNRDELTLTLPAEVVLRGRLVDLQGSPAAGARLEVGNVRRLDAPTREDSQPVFDTPPDGLAFWPAPMTTDEKGGFVLRGLPARSEVSLEVSSEHFARQRLTLVADGAVKTIPLAPLQVVAGRVCAEDTGKPLANARISILSSTSEHGGSWNGMVDGKTNADGRFRIIPYVGAYLTLTVHPPAGVPYLLQRRGLQWREGAARQAVDFKLARGVLVRGKVVEKGSGKPVARAAVGFRARSDNPLLRPDLVPFFQGDEMNARTAADGSFELAVLPGPGHLLVKAADLHYVHVETSEGELERNQPSGQRIYPDALQALNLERGAAPHDVTLTVKRGVTVRGKVVGPDGKAVKKAVAFYRSYQPSTDHYAQATVPIPGGAFELPGLDPDRLQSVFFLDAANQFGATLELPGKEASSEPVTVRLAPCGSARLRLVDQNGKPYAGVKMYRTRPMTVLELVLTPGGSMEIGSRRRQPYADTMILINLDREGQARLVTDAEGRVTLPMLIPGAPHRIEVGEDGKGWVVKKQMTVKAGEVLDLGDLVVHRGERGE